MGQTCVVFWIELQVLLVPRNWIVDGDDEIRHVLPDILLLLTLLLEDAGPVGQCEWPISRKPEKDSVEKIIAEFTIFPAEKIYLIWLLWVCTYPRPVLNYLNQSFSSWDGGAQEIFGCRGGVLIKFRGLIWPCPTWRGLCSEPIMLGTYFAWLTIQKFWTCL